MNDKNWLAANSGAGVDVAERYIAEAGAMQEPIQAIDAYLLAIEVMQIHLGRMDARANERPNASPTETNAAVRT